MIPKSGNRFSDKIMRQQTSLPALDHACAFGSHRRGACVQGPSMEGKAKFIFPVIITGIIVFVVSAVVTFTNIGLRIDFVPRWLKAFITGWPVAAILAFVAVPHIRRATEAIVRLIEG